MGRHETVLFVVVTIMLVLFYVTYQFVAAWMQTRSAPREPMFMCDKHGMFRRVHCVTFMDMPYCPICFHEKSQLAERSL